MAPFFLLALLSVLSLLSSPSAFPIPAGIPQPLLEPPPLPLPEQNPELPASPVSSPTLSPVAADQPAVQQQQQQPPTPSGVSEQSPASPGLAPAVSPGGGANQQPNGGLVQDQQQQLDASVSGGNAQEQEPENDGTGVQPSGGVAQGQDEQGQLQPTGAGVQPIGFGQGQQQQALGFGAQPLVDNTPYDSGSSRLGWSLFACAYGLALLLFMM